MGLWLEARQRAMCRDLLCVAKTAIDAVLEKIGCQSDVEEHAKKLAKAIKEEYLEEPYIFTLGNLTITIYDVDYDVDDCTTDGCEGEVKVEFEVDGDIRQVVKKVLRDMGVNIEICE
jgi:hypothetical protein